MNAPESARIDYTLHDLYAIDDGDRHIFVVNAYAPPLEIDPVSGEPELMRFPVPSPLFKADSDDLVQSFFHVSAQRFGLCAGPMHVLVLNPVEGLFFNSEYFGPSGIDLMTDNQEHQLVVDLNVRITAAYHLGPLQGQFCRQGLLEVTMLANKPLECTRYQFEVFLLPVKNPRDDHYCSS